MTVPRKGDLRYPTLGGTIFFGVFLAMAAALLNIWQHWGIWPWLAVGLVYLYLLTANVLHVRQAKYQEHARLVVDELMTRRQSVDERLPPEDRAAVGFLLMQADGKKSNSLVRSFEAGYAWGRQAEAFLTGLDDSLGDPIKRAAAAYGARAEVGAQLSFQIDELGRAAAIIEHFREALPRMQGHLITNGEATRFSSVDDGFEAWSESPLKGNAPEPGEGSERGFFHCGVAFYAFETQLLLLLRR